MNESETDLWKKSCKDNLKINFRCFQCLHVCQTKDEKQKQEKSNSKENWWWCRFFLKSHLSFDDFPLRYFKLELIWANVFQKRFRVLCSKLSTSGSEHWSLQKIQSSPNRRKVLMESVKSMIYCFKAVSKQKLSTNFLCYDTQYFRR